MQVLSAKGIALIKENIEKEKAIIDFLYGMCGISNDGMANQFGVYCGHHMELQRAKDCIPSLQVQRSLDTAKDLIAYNIKRLCDYESVAGLVFSVIGDTIHDYGIAHIHQWLNSLEETHDTILGDSFILQLLHVVFNDWSCYLEDVKEYVNDYSELRGMLYDGALWPRGQYCYRPEVVVVKILLEISFECRLG